MQFSSFEPCSECDKGYVTIGETTKKCHCLITYQSKVKLDAGLEKAGFSFPRKLSEYLGPDFAKNIPKMQHFLDQYESKFEKDAHLYFWSKANGTQKTSTAQALGTELILRGRSVRFRLMGDLLRLLVDAERNEVLFKEIDDLLRCDFLILDDCFSRKKNVVYSSGYQLAFLDRFLRKRMEGLLKNTVFTSNVPISNIEQEGFSADIQNLLYRKIYMVGAQLEFRDSYVDIQHSFDPQSMWGDL